MGGSPDRRELKVSSLDLSVFAEKAPPASVSRWKKGPAVSRQPVDTPGFPRQAILPASHQTRGSGVSLLLGQIRPHVPVSTLHLTSLIASTSSSPDPPSPGVHRPLRCSLLCASASYLAICPICSCFKPTQVQLLRVLLCWGLNPAFFLPPPYPLGRGAGRGRGWQCRKSALGRLGSVIISSVTSSLFHSVGSCFFRGNALVSKLVGLPSGPLVPSSAPPPWRTVFVSLPPLSPTVS